MEESANDIMARGGANSDSLRLQADLATMHEWAGPEDQNAAVVQDDDEGDEDMEEDDSTAVQDEVQSAAKWPKNQPLESLQDHQYTNNSPSKGKRQRTSGKSDAWQVVKRLVDPALAGGHWTHVCIVCRRLVRCNKNKHTENWVSTNAHNHVVAFKCMDSVASKAEKKTYAKQQRIAFMMDESNKADLVQGPCTYGSLSPATYALTQAARWYIYGRQKISAQTFDDPPFRRMLQAYYQAGGGHGSAPMLARKGLIHYVEAEFACLLAYMKYFADMMEEFTEGNAWAQALHDAATLKNKEHCLAVGMECIDVKCFENHAICMGMHPIKSSEGTEMSSTVDAVTARALGPRSRPIYHSIMSDRAALHVAALVESTESEVDHGDACDMHDLDKVGRSAVGDLTRSKNKKPINPFPGGQALMNKVHAMAKHFSYGDRFSKMLQKAREVFFVFAGMMGFVKVSKGHPK